MNSNISFVKSSYINPILTDNICTHHNEKYESYCKSCFSEICTFCLKSHFNHELINYQSIKPKREEIELLKVTINKYKEDYNKLLSEILSWKKYLDKIIIFFQKQLNDNNIINENINLINNNYDNTSINYNSIIKFRILFENIIEPEKNINNNKILNDLIKDDNNIDDIFNIDNMGIYSYNKYIKAKSCLDKIIQGQNNENNFLLNSNHITEFLWDYYISNNINDDLKNNDNIYNIYNIYNNKNKKIIEKFIDLSRYNKRSKTKNINLNKTQQAFKPKIGNIFLERNYSLPSSNYNTNSIYFKKRSNSNNNMFWNKDRKNISFNINEFNTNLNINKINLYVKNEKLNKTMMFDGCVPKIKIKNRPQQKNKENKNKNKIFIHKKLELANIRQFNTSNIEPKTPKYSNKSEKNKLNEKNGCFSNTSGNKLNSTYIDSENIKQKLNFDYCYNNEAVNNNDMILNNDYIKESEIIYKLPSDKSDKINYNNKPSETLSNNSLHNPNIEIKYPLNTTDNLCIGLEIGTISCKLGIINPILNHNIPLDISSLKENIYSFPFFLSFNEKSSEIQIGQEALDIYLNNSSYTTIFDIINFFGKNTDEIKIQKELYQFKIYSNDNKSFIKINYNNKEKKFNFEDLFTIYMKKIFKKFFQKIYITYELNNPIKINLVIALPDNINYFQRKIIEKIFQTQIFPSSLDKTNESNISDSSNKRPYNKYQIILKNIKIINASCLVYLNYKIIENNNKENILAVVSNGEMINISLACGYKDKINDGIKNIYQIKDEISIKKGECDLINDFIEQKIQLEKKENILNIGDINYLRKICYEFIMNDNAFMNNELKEFIESLNAIYIDIISSIKSLLQKEKINSNNINHIILNVRVLKTQPFIQLLSTLFQENSHIISQLSNEEYITNNNNIIKGTLFHSFNLSLSSPCYILNNISHISFGVDSFGKMEFIIEKGSKIPIIQNKLIKIKNIKEKDILEIKILEGENKESNKNRIISYINIEKKYFKNEKMGDNYIEVLLQFELDKDMNLRVFVLDPKKNKKRFECLINIDIIKG